MRERSQEKLSLSSRQTQSQSLPSRPGLRPRGKRAGEILARSVRAPTPAWAKGLRLATLFFAPLLGLEDPRPDGGGGDRAGESPFQRRRLPRNTIWDQRACKSGPPQHYADGIEWLAQAKGEGAGPLLPVGDDVGNLVCASIAGAGAGAGASESKSERASASPSPISDSLDGERLLMRARARKWNRSFQRIPALAQPALAPP